MLVALSQSVRLAGLVVRSLDCRQLLTKRSSIDSDLLPRRSMYIQLQPSVTFPQAIPLLAPFRETTLTGRCNTLQSRRSC